MDRNGWSAGPPGWQQPGGGWDNAGNPWNDGGPSGGPGRKPGWMIALVAMLSVVALGLAGTLAWVFLQGGDERQAGPTVSPGRTAGSGPSTSTPATESRTSTVTTSPITSTRPERPDGPTLIQDATTAVSSATSVRMAGVVPIEGSPANFEMWGNRDGSKTQMNLDMGTAGNATIIVVDGSVYMRANEAFWAANDGAGMTELVGDKYVKMSASDADMSEFSMDVMLNEVFTEDFSAASGWKDEVEESTLDGRAVYVVSERGVSDGKAYIASDGTNQLLKLEGTDTGGSQVHVTFSEWNAVPVVTAPPADQVIAL